MSFTKEGIEKIYGNPFIGGNSIELLGRGGVTFQRIFQTVRNAKEIICLQFYIYRNDLTGTSLANILKEKAREGVKVYLLYDQWGSFGTPRSFWREMKDEGVRVRASRPFRWRSPRRYLFRDHRKVLLIDSNLAFIGGVNIGDEYRGIRRRKKPWRDTVIMIKGPAASTLMDTFKRGWETGGGEPIGPGTTAHRDVGDLSIVPIFAHSGKGRRRMRRLLYYSINHAQKSIYLTTAYFIPSRRMLETLEAAEQRGVDVKLLVPGKSDVAAAHYAGRAFFRRLLRAGVEIYNYTGPMLHAKSYIFDGTWSIVGSANLDFRSLRWNDEGNAGILSKGFAGEIERMFNEDIANSVKVMEDEWVKRPLWEKIKEWFFSIFRRRL
jgi:cardiolipin synthase